MASHQSSPLLSLPAELRNMIYTHITDSISLVPSDFLGRRQNGPILYHDSMYAGFFGLTQTSSELRAEFRPLYIAHKVVTKSIMAAGQYLDSLATPAHTCIADFAKARLVIDVSLYFCDVCAYKASDHKKGPWTTGGITQLTRALARGTYTNYGFELVVNEELVRERGFVVDHKTREESPAEAKVLVFLLNKLFVGREAAWQREFERGLVGVWVDPGDCPMMLHIDHLGGLDEEQFDFEMEDVVPAEIDALMYDGNQGVMYEDFFRICEDGWSCCYREEDKPWWSEMVKRDWVEYQKDMGWDLEVERILGH